MTTQVASPRARKSFSRIENVLDLPNLIDIQKASFQWFLDEGLRETIDDISPIEDYTGSLAVEFGEYKFGEPQFTIKECREKDLTYQAPLSMTVSLDALTKVRRKAPDSEPTMTLDSLAMDDMVKLHARACKADLRHGGTPDLTASRIKAHPAPAPPPPPAP